MRASLSLRDLPETERKYVSFLRYRFQREVTICNSEFTAVIVTDSRSPIYGIYGRLAIDFLNEAQSLSAGSTSNDQPFLLQQDTIEVPYNDSDATFSKSIIIYKNSTVLLKYLAVFQHSFIFTFHLVLVCSSYNSGGKDGRQNLLLDLTTTPL